MNTIKCYLTSGAHYTLTFESKKQQNLFNKQFDSVMDKAYFDGCNYAAMAYSVSKVLAKHFNIPFESHLKTV